MLISLPILLFLLNNIYCNPPTIDECKIRDNINDYLHNCFFCYQELLVCLFSTELKCDMEKSFTNREYYFDYSNCKDLYSGCATAEKNGCLDGYCKCEKLMIGCITKNKCRPLHDKKLNKSLSNFYWFITNYKVESAITMDKNKPMNTSFVSVNYFDGIFNSLLHKLIK
ncbi:unnamed protein product [Meloidogyne enterolobii]|uniref:Uncharacterized protein n=2 Tax=Meloidogyne enterolobii TaxID=390850 RepID=A0ACB0YVR8_MELEN